MFFHLDTDDKAVKNEPSTSKSAADQSEDSSDDEDTPTEGCTLFVKNLKFSTDDEQLKQVKLYTPDTIVVIIHGKKYDWLWGFYSR